MVTTIQLSEETQHELFMIVTELQAEFGRKVSYDEAIMVMISRIKGIDNARKKFQDMFGMLGSEKSVWKDLRKLRIDEEKRLARLAKYYR